MRDIDIRLALRTEMDRLHGGEHDTLVVEELGLCQGIARIDLAVVNGSVHGFEIKSERDTLARLPYQSSIYNRTLEFVTIVASPNHVQNIKAIIPSWWGIWNAVQSNGTLQLLPLRKARRNRNMLPLAVAQFLWRNEALEVLAEYRLDSGMRSKTRDELWNRLASEFTIEELSHIVRERLKRRGAEWRVPLLRE